METARRSPGFTLLELVIVTAIFAMVLTMAYQTLIRTLEADDRINRMTRSGSIGPAIIGLFRRDIQGAIFQDLGKSVFVGTDDGDQDAAADEFHLLTTAPVPDPLEEVEGWTREIASVGYVLKESSEEQGLTLFRRVAWAWGEEDNPFEDGTYFPVYNRIKALSLRYLNEEGEWLDSWDSEERLQALAELEEEINDGDADSPSSRGEEAPVRPIVIPRAVEITLFIYIGDETGLLLNEDREPIVEEYRAVVSTLTTESMDLEPEEEPGANGVGGG